jgi:UDP-glucose 4-epimerase
MRILVTGATGMVGCHTVAALAKAGHEVRLLARNSDRVGRALDPLGVQGFDRVIGDVTDPDAVERAVSGCDALVHAAGVFTLDRRRDDEMMHVNVRGAEIVFDAALRAKLDPIVHVSSVVALFPPTGDRFGPDEAVKHPTDAYARSKADAERIARRHQDAGAPIVSVYPGSVWGPYDPTLADGIEVIMMFVKLGIIPVAPGGIPIVDVRDLAALLAAVMEPGRGPRRYMAGGSFLNNAELTDILNELTGRKLRKLYLSGALFRGIGRIGDTIRRSTGFDIGLTYEATVTLTHGVPCDDSRALEDFGIRFRPVAETLRDSLRWMYAEGKLSRRAAGELAG